MKSSDRSTFPIGVHSGSCGKQEMLEHGLNEMKKQEVEIVVADPQQELEALTSALDEKDGGQ